MQYLHVGNDRLKFRIWSVKLNRYYWNYAVNTDGDLVKWMSNHKEEDVGEKLIIEQHTGIYDRKHNPIYEGDILKDTRSNKIYQVCWVGCMASFAMVLLDGEEKINPKSLYFANQSFGWFEIVGNIHTTLQPPAKVD